jgi:hypothetical protein
MSIERVTNIYEILFRFDEQTGAFKGAHQQDITLLVEDGAAISGSVGDAKPLDFGNPATSELLDEVLQKALAANDQLKADIERVKALNDALNRSLAEAIAEVATTNAATAATNEENARLAVQNHILSQQIAAAQSA